MRKRPIALLFFSVFLLCLTTCLDGAGTDLFFVPDPPSKSPPNSRGAIVKAALYIDTERGDAREVLSKAGNYVLKDSGIGYFDFVILSGALVKNGKYSMELEFLNNFMNIVENWETYIKPLQNKGIKVLFGIKGGHAGVSSGSMLRFFISPGQIAEHSEMQLMAARQIINFCKSRGIDGIELYDIDCEIPGGQTPYPAKGQSFWNGEVSLPIPADGKDPETGVDLYNKYWDYGGGNLADLLCCIVLGFGAESSFQGDLDPNATRHHPILLREVNFVRYLPKAIPRFPFGATSACISYVVNDEPTWGAVKQFPVKDAEGNPTYELLESGTSILPFINENEYAPIILDLENLSDSDLAAYSQKFLHSYENGQQSQEELPATRYGLVYYTNLSPDSAKMAEKLSVTSRKVFREEVVFKQ